MYVLQGVEQKWWATGDKLAKALPALGILATMGGCPVVGKCVGQLGLVRPAFAAILLTLKGMEVRQEGLGEGKLTQVINLLELVTGSLVVGEASLKLANLRFSSPVLAKVIQSAALLNVGISLSGRLFKAKRVVRDKLHKGDGKLELASHLLAISAAILSLSYLAEPLKGLGKGAIVVGTTAELWLLHSQ